MTIPDDVAIEYLVEVQLEAEQVERRVERFRAAADRWLVADITPQPNGAALWSGITAEEDMLAAIEGILAGFARVSLFFFPESRSKAFGRERAAVPRRLAAVPDDDPIGRRGVRNDWMHLDERIDQHVQTHGFTPIGTQLGRHDEVHSSQRAAIFRLIDPANETVYIFGTPYPLPEIASAVANVGGHAALAIVAVRAIRPRPSRPSREGDAARLPTAGGTDGRRRPRDL